MINSMTGGYLHHVFTLNDNKQAASRSVLLAILFSGSFVGMVAMHKEDASKNHGNRAYDEKKHAQLQNQ
jgi:hypothetical protein